MPLSDPISIRVETELQDSVNSLAKELGFSANLVVRLALSNGLPLVRKEFATMKPEAKALADRLAGKSRKPRANGGRK